MLLLVSATKRLAEVSTAKPRGKLKLAEAPLPSEFPGTDGAPAKTESVPARTRTWAAALFPSTLVTVSVKVVLAFRFTQGSGVPVRFGTTPGSTVEVRRTPPRPKPAAGVIRT